MLCKTSEPLNNTLNPINAFDDILDGKLRQSKLYCFQLKKNNETKMIGRQEGQGTIRGSKKRPHNIFCEKKLRIALVLFWSVPYSAWLGLVAGGKTTTREKPRQQSSFSDNLVYTFLAFDYYQQKTK